MKTRINFIIGVVIGILAGGTVVGIYEQHSYHKNLQKYDSINQAYIDRAVFLEGTSSITEHLLTLRGLRNGKVAEVINFHEGEMSSGIEKLVTDYPQLALSDPTAVKLLKRVSQYDDKYPLHSSDSNTEQAVTLVLKKIRTAP